MLSMPLREAHCEALNIILGITDQRFSGNISQTAHFVGMERSALHRKLKLLNVGSKEKDLQTNEGYYLRRRTCGIQRREIP